MLAIKNHWSNHKGTMLMEKNKTDVLVCKNCCFMLLNVFLAMNAISWADKAHQTWHTFGSIWRRVFVSYTLLCFLIGNERQDNRRKQKKTELNCFWCSVLAMYACGCIMHEYWSFGHCFIHTIRFYSGFWKPQHFPFHSFFNWSNGRASEKRHAAKLGCAAWGSTAKDEKEKTKN